jgi:hypothetical protein
VDRKETLERELRDRRDDVELWQVYADHLATIDPALSQWLALHLAKERGAQVNAEIGELYVEIMGAGLITLLMPATKSYVSRARLGYLHGFIDLAEIDLAVDDHPEDRFAALRYLFAMRASGFMRRLELKIDENCAEDALLVLAAYAMPSLEIMNVRLQEIGEVEDEDDDYEDDEDDAGVEDIEEPHARPGEPFAIAETTRAAVFRAAPRLERFQVRWDDGTCAYERSVTV